MTTDSIAYARSFAAGLPEPKGRESARPRYNFGTGHNDPAAIPSTELARAAAEIIEREGASLALYNLGGSPLGHAGLRDTIARKLTGRRGIDCTAEDILITTGSLQGMDLVNDLLLEPGDCVIIEQFTYVAALSKVKALGVEAVPVSLNEGGIDVEDLRRVLASLQAAGRRPKYIYTIPTVQNPTGSIMSLDRRRALLALAREFGIPVFEDECYADLVWSGEAPPALYALDPQNVLHIGSLSKTLAPALRLGYVVAPWPALGQMLALKGDAGTGALDQMAAAAYFSQAFETHVANLSGRLEKKLDLLIETCAREFGTALEIARPDGGLFAWARFPEGVDTRMLAEPAARAGISFNPGSEWSVRPEDGTRFMRLCFAVATEEEIEEGITALASISHEVLGLPERSHNRARG